MQATQHALMRLAVVFLHECALGNVFAKPVVAERFHKKAARIAEDVRVDAFHIGQAGGGGVHWALFPLIKVTA